MNDPFLPRRAVHRLTELYSMSQETSLNFYRKSDQMRYWLSDPILRADAMQWFEGEGYAPVRGDSGEIIDYQPHREDEPYAS